jgi:cytolysin-activating lysine-acyltransferase
MDQKSGNLKNGVLSKISGNKLNLLIGEITSLLLLSPVHRKFQVRDIADIILPAIDLGQYRIYRNAKRQPIAFVTWGYFDEKTEQEYLNGKTVLSEKELKSGDILYMLDFIAPYGHAKKVINDLRSNVFPNSEAKSLHFIEQGKHRKKIKKFHGVNFKKPVH